MALDKAPIFEIRSGGNDLNGGGFITGGSGTDYSQQDSAQLTVTDAACTGNTTLTSSTGGFTSEMVDNIVCIDDGGTYDWFQITGYTDTNTVTIDRNGPNSSGMTARVGGAFKTPGGWARAMNAIAADSAFDQDVAGATWCEGSTAYTLTTTTANVPGGPVDFSGASFENHAHFFRGYTSSRDEDDTGRCTIDCGTQAVTHAFRLQGGSTGAQHGHRVTCDGGGVGGTSGLFNGNSTYTTYFDCIAHDSAASGFANSQSYGCEAYNNATSGFSAAAILCKAYDNTGDGFTSSAYLCVAWDNGSSGFSGSNSAMVRCTSHSNGNAGFRINNDGRGGKVIDCIAYANNDNLESASASNQMMASVINFAHGGGVATEFNSTGVLNDAEQYVNLIPLTADPFVDSAGHDYNLNDTAGGGADCQEQGFFGSDIGAFPRVPSGGGGGGALLRQIGINGGLNQ